MRLDSGLSRSYNGFLVGLVCRLLNRRLGDLLNGDLGVGKVNIGIRGYRQRLTFFRFVWPGSYARLLCCLHYQYNINRDTNF